jgi:putative transposase
MCAYLLVAFLKFQSGLHKSLQQILRILHLNLFEKRDLMALLWNAPGEQLSPHTNQMALL